MKWAASQVHELPTTKTDGEDGIRWFKKSVDGVRRFYAFIAISYLECYRLKGFGHCLVVKDEEEEGI